MAQILLNKRILVAATLIAVGVAAFFVLRPGEPMPPASGENAPAVVNGAITGLPPQTEGTEPRIAIFSIVDPATALIAGGKASRDDPSSYRIETSPGWRMVILQVWDRSAGKLYAGASRAFILSAGETRTANIVLEETRILNDVSSETDVSAGRTDKHAISARMRPIVRNALMFFRFQPVSAAEQEDKPAFAVDWGMVYRENAAWLETDLAVAGFRMIAIDPSQLGIVEKERGLEDQGILPSGTYGDYNPAVPNFVIKLKVKFVDNSPRITISITDARNLEMVWQDTTIEDATHRDLWEITTLAIENLHASFEGRGFNPIELPSVTPSVHTPTNESPAAWGARIRKELGLEDLSGLIELIPDDDEMWQDPPFLQLPTQLQQPKQSQPKPPPSCDIPVFQACANTFSLQGCIDSCPYVPTECPAGTSPGTECKKTDQACSDQCWVTADAHLASCLQSSHCTQEQVVAGGGGATR